MRTNGQIIRKIIQTSLFIALSLALRSFSYMFYFAGAAGMRISLTPVFSRMPAILFGPLYGGLATGIVDILGFIIKPEGPYIPLLTVTAVLDGVIAGTVWKLIKKLDTQKLRKILWISLSSIGIFGFFNLIITRFYPTTSISKVITSLGKKSDFLVFGLLVVSVIGLILLTVDYLVQKKLPQASIHKYYLIMMLTFGSAGMTVTVLNTFILRWFIPALGKIGFIAFLIPRIIEETLIMVLLSYIAAFLLSIYDRLIGQSQDI